MLVMVMVVTGQLLAYYIACYIIYAFFLVLFLYIYVCVADADKPFIDTVTGQPILQIPGTSICLYVSWRYFIKFAVRSKL